VIVKAFSLSRVKLRRRTIEWTHLSVSLTGMCMHVCTRQLRGSEYVCSVSVCQLFRVVCTLYFCVYSCSVIVESESETVRETDKTLFTLDLHLTLQTFCIIADTHASDIACRSVYGDDIFEPCFL